jgi:hypothetical protein
MGLEGKTVINLENDYVDSLLRQSFQILSKEIEVTVGVVIQQM